jgi:hypothetical protein
MVWIPDLFMKEVLREREGGEGGLAAEDGIYKWNAAISGADGGKAVMTEGNNLLPCSLENGIPAESLFRFHARS